MFVCFYDLIICHIFELGSLLKKPEVKLLLRNSMTSEAKICISQLELLIPYSQLDHDVIVRRLSDNQLTSPQVISIEVI